jgi:hypothetical protein
MFVWRTGYIFEEKGLAVGIPVFRKERIEG